MHRKVPAFKNERQAFILKQINLHNKVSSSALSAQLKVSEDTIRRDLAELADAGELVKVHGGALSKSYHYPAQQSKTYAQAEKKKIAAKALQLIKPGMTSLTEAGTTMLELVKMLPGKLEATFFTVSPLMALHLAEFPLLTVVLLGGEVDMASQITIGARPVQELSGIKVDMCILGVNALNATDGLTEMDWKVVQVKKAMIGAADTLVVLTISEKLDSTFTMQLCKPQKISCLVTELSPIDKKLDPYRKHMKVL